MKPIKLKNLSNISFTQCEYNPHVINVTASIDNDSYPSKVGRFNFVNSEGYLNFEEGTNKDGYSKQKDYKQFKSFMNYIFKCFPDIWWSDTDIKLAQQAAIEESININASFNKVEELPKVIETVISVNNTIINETPSQSFRAYNRSFSTYSEAHTFCINSDFDPSHIIEVVDNSTALNHQPDTIIDPIQYHLYKHTFNSYNEAFNYACKNNITASMIIPSNSSISNEQLQSLERQYTTGKYKMSYNDAQTFLSHLNSIPTTSYSEDRIYDMKHIIQRYEARQAEEKQKNDNQIFMATQIEIMLTDMYSKGVIKVENNIMVKYYYNNECIYTWFSGITTEKMYNDLLEVYNRYFNIQSNHPEFTITDHSQQNYTYTPLNILTS